jgi:hypothetical protein
MMVENISMLNMLITRKKMGLFLNCLVVRRFTSKNNPGSSKGLDPYWVTGIVDAEGSFIVGIKINSQSKKHQVQASIEISFHVRDLDLLYKIQSFFRGVGVISIPSTRNAACLKITKLDDLIHIIIPHFKQYPLQGAKKIDFYLWLQCAELMKNKEHLKEAGLYKILSIKSVLNKGLPDKLKAAFPNVKSINKPLLEVDNTPLNPNYVSGFTEGDACFSVNVSSRTNQVIAIYKADLHNKEIPLLHKLQEFFGGVGKINASSLRDSACFTVAKKADLVKVIIPHFDAYKLVGYKLKNYLI